MKCKKCGLQIEEDRTFCEFCESQLNESSSKSKVKELEFLIKKQNNDLENTKELFDLDKLVKEEIKDSNFQLEENRMDRYTKRSKKNKKILIVVLISIILVSLIGVILFFILNKKEPIENDIPLSIDYEKVINEYGDIVYNIINDYNDTFSVYPDWEYIEKEIKYDKYNVSCSIHNIYDDGTIYLDSCTVDSKKIKYSYGSIKEEISKKINIYSLEQNDYILYLEEAEKDSLLVGTITCKTEECEYISAYDKYAIIKEDEYYIYDYTNDTLIFGPFKLNEKEILHHENTLYGVIYEENNKFNIYNVKKDKILKNIKGDLLEGNMNLIPSMFYKYNYVILKNKGIYNFVNLNTGNISYSIEENISNFIENKDKKIIYITTYIDDPTNFKIMNSNGKLLFNGESYSKFILNEDSILVGNKNKFKIYDYDLKLKITSKTYDDLIAIYKDYVVVVEDSNLKIVDFKDKEIVKFDYELKDNHKFDNMLSGIVEEDNKKGIYLIFENSDIPLNESGHIVQFYYIFDTKESNVVEQ